MFGQNRSGRVTLGTRTTAAVLALAAAAALPGVGRAATIYYDTNTATAGTGTPVPDWNSTTTCWTTDSTGSSATLAWPASGTGNLDGSDVVFSAGTNAPATYAVNVAGNKRMNSLTIEEGAITLRTLGASLATRTVGAGGITLNASTEGSTAVGNLAINASTGTAGALTMVVGASQSWTINHPTATMSVSTPIISNAAAETTYTLTAVPHGSGDITLSGAIGDGTAGGKLAVAANPGTAGGRVVLSGSNTYTGATSVLSGTLVLGAAAQAAVLTGGGADVVNGRLVFDYTGGTTPAAAVRQALATAAGGGFVTGQIRSSTATAAKGLGYIDDGVSAVTVKTALFGDADLDGGVSINDFNALAGSFGQAAGKAWIDGDFDYDGGVSINDFNLLAGNFGKTASASGDAWGGLLAFAAAHNDLAAFEAITGVPEPTALGVVAVGMTIGLRRRRGQ